MLGGEAEGVDRTGALTGVIVYCSRVVLGAELWGRRLEFGSLDVACLCC